MSISGNSNNVLAARMAGVKVATDGSPAQRGKPNTVTGVVKGSVVFVWHNDLRGNPALAMYFEVNGEYYSTPDTTEWCDRLRPMADWMRKDLANRVPVSSSPEQIPKTDAVDLLGDGEDEAGATGDGNEVDVVA